MEFFIGIITAVQIIEFLVLCGYVSSLSDRKKDNEKKRKNNIPTSDADLIQVQNLWGEPTYITVGSIVGFTAVSDEDRYYQPKAKTKIYTVGTHYFTSKTVDELKEFFTGTYDSEIVPFEDCFAELKTKKPETVFTYGTTDEKEGQEQ